MTLNMTRYRKAEGLDRSEMDDGYLIYDRQNDRVHLLNPTAAIVFEFCDGAHTAAQIALYLEEAFKLSEPQLSTVGDCLSSLESQGLIEPCATS